MSWTRQQAKALADQILSYSKAKECEVALDESRASYTRFAANDITTSGTSRTLNIGVTSRDGKRSGTVHASDPDPAVLKSTVRCSEELMEASSGPPKLAAPTGPDSRHAPCLRSTS